MTSRHGIGLALAGVVLAGGACEPDDTDAPTEPLDTVASAERLAETLQQLPGVRRAQASVEHGEEGPDWWDTSVRMRPSATADDVAGVLSTTYDVYAGPLPESARAGLAIQVGDSTVALVTAVDPAAPKADVLAAAAWSLSVVGPGEYFTLELNPGDESPQPPLDAHLELYLRAGTTEADILPALQRLAEESPPATIDIGVTAGDRSALAGADGLPSTADIAWWQALDAVPAPTPIRVLLSPADMQGTVPRTEAVMVMVDLPPGIEPRPGRRLRAMIRSHLTMLRADADRFIYSVEVNGRGGLWMDSAHCTRGGKRWGIRTVMRWFYGPEADCFRR